MKLSLSFSVQFSLFPEFSNKFLRDNYSCLPFILYITTIFKNCSFPMSFYLDFLYMVTMKTTRMSSSFFRLDMETFGYEKHWSVLLSLSEVLVNNCPCIIYIVQASSSIFSKCTSGWTRRRIPIFLAGRANEALLPSPHAHAQEKL